LSNEYSWINNLNGVGQTNSNTETPTGNEVSKMQSNQLVHTKSSDNLNEDKNITTFNDSENSGNCSTVFPEE